jgi:hypothetical protein
MKRFPLLFSFKNVLVGNGFVAGVAMDGRALLVEEEDGVWMMYGVNPGGMAAEGATKDEAMEQFRVSYDSILNEIAAGSSKFKELEAEVQRLFHQVDDEDAWIAAVDEVRRTGEKNNWEKSIRADSPRSVQIVKLTRRNADPVMNRDPHENQLAVAA